MAEALGNYRQDHKGALPDRLGNLFPEYVSDSTLLQCPAAFEHGTAGTANPIWIDPSEKEGIVVGYTWERSPDDPSYWDRTGWGMSFAQFRELQSRSLVSNYVPVIRCSHHGENRVLNLTLAGAIYESGEYWECNFVDVLSGIRLSPRLVALADKPMSALVRPRPSWATAAMLDLRPWYNARFADPWVNGELEMERLQPNRELDAGIVTNQGVTFDATGIIQLNGKLVPTDDPSGYDRLIYPTAVKSISVRKPFRIMHLLGAVQFQDPPGTTVAAIELHRAGSPVEKWTWRYGVDVLNYRFNPEKPEPRLQSTVVAWTGAFADPRAQNQKPRLFHLRFVTAEPETPVDHLDFLAGEGVSSPFIVAITLE
jgi:hypothetical protein